jgi:hypothetical protein
LSAWIFEAVLLGRKKAKKNRAANAWARWLILATCGASTELVASGFAQAKVGGAQVAASIVILCQLVYGARNPVFM